MKIGSTTESLGYVAVTLLIMAGVATSFYGYVVAFNMGAGHFVTTFLFPPASFIYGLIGIFG